MYIKAIWIKTYELLNDDLIWFYCNHHHIFMDSNSDYLKLVVDTMKTEKEPYYTMHFSHWQR